jgi:hypothetical protein
MSKFLDQLFDDDQLVKKIKSRLPNLFQIAEVESSRAGKIGMEVGSIRERIIIALLMYKFGELNVNTNIPITQSEVDVTVFGEPISIKTVTGKTFGGVKLIWTVDADSARGFQNNYTPCCDILLVQIVWGEVGGLFYIPLEIQKMVLREIGRTIYIKLPKIGTNPRGVEFSKEALNALVQNEKTRKIAIPWKRQEIHFDAYGRWLDFWRND